MENLFSVKEQKKTLRKIYRNRRQGLPEVRKREASSLLTKFISNHLTTNGCIMSFLSFCDEIDTAETNKFLYQKQLLVLPKIDPNTKSIRPTYCSSYQEQQHLFMEENDKSYANSRLKLNEINVILVPGLAFDPISKHRLGYGKGYYDRFLKETALYSILTIGIGFIEQAAFSLPIEPHDVPLSKILFF